MKAVQYVPATPSNNTQLWYTKSAGGDNQPLTFSEGSFNAKINSNQWDSAKNQFVITFEAGEHGTFAGGKKVEAVRQQKDEKIQKLLDKQRAKTKKIIENAKTKKAEAVNKEKAT